MQEMDWDLYAPVWRVRVLLFGFVADRKTEKNKAMR